jgi:hypothetical protein
MKKILPAFIIALFIQSIAWAQQGYTFSQTTGIYADLVNPTTISGSNWDQDNYEIPVGFNFSFDNLTVDSVIVDDNGSIYFTNGTVLKSVDGFYADLAASPTNTPSNISYLLTGPAGDRVLKVQWKNAGFYGDTNVLANEYVNFQIWLYEGSNKLEVRVGPSVITSGATIFGTAGGPDVGLALTITQQNFSGLYLQGSPAAPTVISLTNATTFPSLSAPPVDGTIYIFSRNISGVAQDLYNPAVSVYPNPTSGILNISGLPENHETATVRIFDMLGRAVLSETLKMQGSVDLSQLNKGAYFLEIVNGKSRIGKNIIKQ